MIIWLASYPRSGNTLLRVMLNHIFGLKTWSLYNDMLDLGADPATAAAVGHQLLDADFRVAEASADDQRWLLKTHDYPEDNSRAIYIVRDGRETLTSYLFYFQRILGQQPSLRDLITGATPFGSWSDHLAVWQPATRPGTLLLRFEDVLADPQAAITTIGGFLEIEPVARRMPSFSELQALNPAFFRSGRNDTWTTQFSAADLELFWELHGAAMLEYGYTASADQWRAALRSRPASLVATPGELRGQVPSGLPRDPAEAERAELERLFAQRGAEIVRLRAGQALGRRDLQRSEEDRLARLAVIERQGAQLGQIAGLEQQVAELSERLAASEEDRLARLAVIERQGAELGRLAGLEQQVAELSERLAASEEDRLARLAVIEQQGAELAQQQQYVSELEQRLTASEADRAARLAVIEQQGAELGRLRERVNAFRALLWDVRHNRRNLVRRATWRRARILLAELYHERSSAPATLPAADLPTLPLADYIVTVDQFTNTAKHHDLMKRIRAYNHTIIDHLHKSRPLEGVRLLDIGASPHGYALEHALGYGVAEYVGIGLDINEPIAVYGPTGQGRLVLMNAEQLDFPDGCFDLVVSLSTFEHITSVPRALAEIGRVLKPGGSALITFEPIWTCSYGHHLHHFGPVSQLVPPWAHLRWTKQQMLEQLAAVWPADAPLTLQAAAEWTYDSDAINRVGIVEMRGHFAACGLPIEWIVPMADDPHDAAALDLAVAATKLAPEDLMTKGLTVLLNKPNASVTAPPVEQAPPTQLPIQHGGTVVMTKYLRTIRSTIRLLRYRNAQPSPRPMASVAPVRPRDPVAELAAAELAKLSDSEPTEQEYYDQIREPKAQKVVHYNPQNLEQITAELLELGFRVKDLTVDPQAYRAYFTAAQYPPSYYAFNLPEKSLEHYIAAQLLELGPDDVYIDIASEHSPVPEIYSRLYGCTSYRQDLAYQAGMHGDRIGGDAAAMPVPDGFASKMALHCSFEHFEGDADSRFIRECERVLRAGGKVCFAPIYLFNEFVNQAGAAAAIKGQVEFDAEAVVYAKSGWRHRFARYYDPQHLASRIRAYAGELDLTVYRVLNPHDVDPSCYIRFVLVVEAPPEA